MSKALSITLPDNVYSALKRYKEQIAKQAIPGVTITASGCITIALKEFFKSTGTRISEPPKDRRYGKRKVQDKTESKKEPKKEPETVPVSVPTVDDVFLETMKKLSNPSVQDTPAKDTPVTD